VRFPQPQGLATAANQKLDRKEQLLTMENRIRQMESVITSAISNSTKPSDIDSYGEGNIERQMTLSDSLSMLVINDTGGSLFVGMHHRNVTCEKSNLKIYRSIFGVFAFFTAWPCVDF